MLTPTERRHILTAITLEKAIETLALAKGRQRLAPSERLMVDLWLASDATVRTALEAVLSDWPS